MVTIIISFIVCWEPFVLVMVCRLKYLTTVSLYYMYVYLDAFLEHAFADFFCCCHDIFSEGAHDVLTSLGAYPGIVNAIQTGLLNVVTTLSDCTVTK